MSEKKKTGSSARTSKSSSTTAANDWRAETLARMRALILKADPEMVEEVKWRKPTKPEGVPVWSHNGIVCTGETYKDKVKLTFFQGASLPDPAGLFTADDNGNTRRAMDIHEGETINAAAFQALIKAAVALNGAPGKKSDKTKPKSGMKKSDSSKLKKNEQSVVLLSGGNPQIAKGYGDAPVLAYIAALSDWKQDLCRRLDALIVRTVPNVYKAVKWNSPFYGFEGQGWFLSFHVFARYLKVAFFRGASLKPMPPGTSKQKEVRYLDIHEDDAFDEKQIASWIQQSAALPLEKI